MGESDMAVADIGHDLVRLVFSTLDRPVYWLLGMVYQIFFNVASADIFSSSTVFDFYKRVQLIIGVFMMFKMSVVVLRGIVSPDSFTDSKTGGGNLIKRIAISLILLTLVVPIGIPNASNEFERQINNNGILFGTLNSLQYRILANNTLGRLILGNDDNSESLTAADSSNPNYTLERSSRIFTSSVLKGFYRINLLPRDKWPAKYQNSTDGKDPAIHNELRVCQNLDDAILNEYTRLDADPQRIIDMAMLDCEYDDAELGLFESAVSIFSPKLAGKNRYAFTHVILVPLIVGVFFVFILISFTVDVAVRAIKLAILRLIAPIPIISYMDPKGGQDGAFNAWVKSISTTYLDLFIRLAVVFFIVFLIQNMIVNGIVINNADGIIGILSMIFIWIGLFVFAKQAPKFLRDALGIKGDGGKLFGGLGEMMGVGAVAAGAIGGGISRGVATKTNGGNMAKSILSGIAGGVGGGINSGKAFLNSKDTDSKALMNTARAYNAKNYSNAADKSTFGGRTVAGLQSSVGLKTAAEKYDDKIKDYNAATSAWKRVNTALTSDSKKMGYSGATLTTQSGETIFENGKQYSSKDAEDIVSRMKSSGQYSQKEIEQAENARNDIHAARFDEIRKTADPSSLTGTASQVYSGAQTIYTIGSKYSGDQDGVFSSFAGAGSVADSSLQMGKDFKGSSYNADRQADAIKNSPQYAEAQANAQRADQKKK